MYYREFIRRIRDYHDKLSPCNSTTYSYVYRLLHLDGRKTLSRGIMDFVIDSYIGHWGSMVRVIGGTHAGLADELMRFFLPPILLLEEN